MEEAAGETVDHGVRERPARPQRERQVRTRERPAHALGERAGHEASQREGQPPERLRGKLWWSNIAVGLLPEQFTMPQARRVFEAISGVVYEPSNFRRELEQSGLVRATGMLARHGPGRPAALYEFVERRPAWSLRRSRPPATARARE